MFFDILISLIIVGFVIFIVYLIFDAIKESINEKEKAKQKMLEDKKSKERIDKDRQVYYNNLPHIYDDLSTQTLKNAYTLLDIIVRCRNPYENIGVFVPMSKETLNVWSESEEKFVNLINPNGEKKWKNINGSSEKPSWEDLDLKYVKNLLNRR